MLVVAVVAEDGEAYAVGLAGPTRLDRSLRRRAATLLTVDAPANFLLWPLGSRLALRLVMLSRTRAQVRLATFRDETKN